MESRKRKARQCVQPTAVTHCFLLVAVLLLRSVSCFQQQQIFPLRQRNTFLERMATEAAEIPPPQSAPYYEEVNKRGGSVSSTAIGKWEELDGNFILRPSIEDGPPRALGTSWHKIGYYVLVYWKFEYPEQCRQRPLFSVLIRVFPAVKRVASF